MKLVPYYRVSTSKQARSGLGLEGQKATVKQFAAAHGAEVLKSYVEVETGKSADRPELGKAVAHVVGLDAGEETVEKEGMYDGLEIDLVTHDAKKFFGLMLKKNGYVLEQVFSPLVVHSTPEHEELKAIAANCITRHHAHHYLGFAATQWKLFRKEEGNPRFQTVRYAGDLLFHDKAFD